MAAERRKGIINITFQMSNNAKNLCQLLRAVRQSAFLLRPLHGIPPVTGLSGLLLILLPPWSAPALVGYVLSRCIDRNLNCIFPFFCYWDLGSI
jgi:hypothetical protein